MKQSKMDLKKLTERDCILANKSKEIINWIFNTIQLKLWNYFPNINFEGLTNSTYFKRWFKDNQTMLDRYRKDINNIHYSLFVKELLVGKNKEDFKLFENHVPEAGTLNKLKDRKKKNKDAIELFKTIKVMDWEGFDPYLITFTFPNWFWNQNLEDYFNLMGKVWKMFWDKISKLNFWKDKALIKKLEATINFISHSFNIHYHFIWFLPKELNLTFRQKDNLTKLFHDCYCFYFGEVQNFQPLNFKKWDISKPNFVFEIAKYASKVSFTFFLDDVLSDLDRQVKRQLKNKTGDYQYKTSYYKEQQLTLLIHKKEYEVIVPLINLLLLFAFHKNKHTIDYLGMCSKSNRTALFDKYKKELSELEMIIPFEIKEVQTATNTYKVPKVTDKDVTSEQFKLITTYEPQQKEVQTSINELKNKQLSLDDWEVNSFNSTQLAIENELAKKLIKHFDDFTNAKKIIFNKEANKIERTNLPVSDFFKINSLRFILKPIYNKWKKFCKYDLTFYNQSQFMLSICQTTFLTIIENVLNNQFSDHLRQLNNLISSDINNKWNIELIIKLWKLEINNSINEYLFTITAPN